MPTSKYFNHTNNRAEQNLVEDLLVEAIFLYGTEAFYIPRDSTQEDIIWGEDQLKTFTTNYPIEIFNSDTMDFEGQKEVFSKFGIEMKLDFTVLLSRKTFLQRVAQNNNYSRPLEGDLIWIPHVRGKGILYEITFVNPEDDMFVLGRSNPYYYKIKLEQFKYSNEIINTGQEEVDAIPGQDSYTISFLVSATSSQGNYIVNEVVTQGSASAHVSSWDRPSLTLNVTNISGVFSGSANVIGSTSNAHYRLISYDNMQDNLPREPFDNEEIKTEGEGYINTDEINPFAEI